MQIKRYETKNLQEASLRIRRDLGPDAIILSTKRISADPPLIEVVAARDERHTPAPVQETPAPARDRSHDDSLAWIVKEMQGLRASIDDLSRRCSGWPDMAELKGTLERLADGNLAGIPLHLRDLYIRLLANGVSGAKALSLIDAIHQSFPPQQADTPAKGSLIAEKLISRSLAREDLRSGTRIKAFIGPTGVGKTTTLAKLAARYSIEQKKKVGLITTDTFRIAAAEQLKVYAKIMALPLQVAADAAAFARALTNLSDRELILVDTPGHNPHDEGYLGRLKTLCGDGIESLLLLNATAAKPTFRETAELFRTCRYDRLILTKLDECSHLGSLYDLLEEVDKPVSYVTTGQNVPTDIEQASPDRLARMILQNRLN